MLLYAMFALPAAAHPDDALQLYAGAAYGHDDNLLRVPDNRPAFDGALADSWWRREGGLIFDNTYGGQRIFITARASRYDFERFKQLSYSGKNLQAIWFWRLANHLDGRIGTAYERTLTPYTDVQSGERNLRFSHSQFAEGTWRLHPAWKIRTGLQRNEYQYELFVERFNNRIENAAEAEFDYLSSSGSIAGVLAKRVRGTYPYARALGSFPVSDDFRQDELKVYLLWLITGTTNVEALVGYTRRDQIFADAGRTSGPAGKVKATYEPRGKIKYNAAVWRDFAPLESTVVSYALNKGISVGAQWDATAKLKVNADTVYERRLYNTRATFAASGGIRDAIHTSNLSVTWSPRPTVHVVAEFAHQARSGASMLGTGRFRSNSVVLSTSAQF